MLKCLTRGVLLGDISVNFSLLVNFYKWQKSLKCHDFIRIENQIKQFMPSWGFKF